MSTAINTVGIVLARTNFGEADRILTLITPDHGKRRLMAKGVRKERSKLAGGIELFSVSHISYIPGKKEIDTLISTRLKKHYGKIVTNVERTMLGYELLKRLNRATEDVTGEEYFSLLERALEALDDTVLNLDMIELWFNAQLLKTGGHQPNLKTDVNNKPLMADKLYSFDDGSTAFEERAGGPYNANHIKLLRLVFSDHDPQTLKQLKDVQTVILPSTQLVQAMLNEYIRL